MDKLAKKKVFKQKGKFLWPSRDEPIRVRVPVEGVRESFRPVEHITVEEVEKAMGIVAGHSFEGMSLESLYLETAKLLGFRRIGPNIQIVLDRVYRNLKNQNKLIEKKGQVYQNKE